MIPRAHITAWRAHVPWPLDAQVEQDLVLSRALIEIFSESLLANSLAVRGGTALHKLYLTSPARYSEDIDLVQIKAAPIGPLLDALRTRLDPWFGEPKRRRGPSSVALIYRFETEMLPTTNMRLKIEINTREHFNVLSLEQRPFEIANPWFSGGASLTVYQLDELLGTKLRALYQRKKGRDLFDLWYVLNAGLADSSQVVRCFLAYISAEGNRISRVEFEQNLVAKLQDRAFVEDIEPLLVSGVGYDVSQAAEVVNSKLITCLP